MAQQPCSVQGGLQSLKGTCFSKAEVVELVLRWKSKEPPVQLTKSPPRCLQQQAPFQPTKAGLSRDTSWEEVFRQHIGHLPLVL